MHVAVNRMDGDSIYRNRDWEPSTQTSHGRETKRTVTATNLYKSYKLQQHSAHRKVSGKRAYRHYTANVWDAPAACC